jgi:mono/diheme cytochrome c family protein
MRLLRWAGYGIGGVLLLALAAIWVLSSRKMNARIAPQPSSLPTLTAEQRADGPRQLRALGCVNCHGEDLQGKKFFDESGVATLYAANLRRVAAVTSDAQLDHAIRQGIGHDGRPLFAMPSQQYQFLTDTEVAALIAAIRALPPAGADTPPIKVGFIGRVGLVTRKFKPAPDLIAEYRAAALADFGPAFAAGRHVIATRCSECHGPQLRGADIEPGLHAPDLAIAAAYDLEAFRTLLRTGAPLGGRQLRTMDRVARSGFSHLSDEEIAAVHAYLVERTRHAQ